MKARLKFDEARQLAAGNSLAGQAFRFLVMAGTSALTTVGLPVLLHQVVGVEEEIAVGIAFCCALMINFFGARRLVFRSTQRAGRDFRVFLLSSVMFRSLEYGAFLSLHTGFGFPYVHVLVATLICSTVAKFFWYRHFLSGSSRLVQTS